MRLNALSRHLVLAIAVFLFVNAQPLCSMAQDGGPADIDWLTSFNISYWGRCPDPQGLDCWVGEIQRGAVSGPADAGVLYWVGELRSGRTTPGLVIGNIINAAIEANTMDWLTIWNKVQVAEYFTQRFAASGRTWTDAHLDLARQALVGVTDDPDTVVAGRARVDGLLP